MLLLFSESEQSLSSEILKFEENLNLKLNRKIFSTSFKFKQFNRDNVFDFKEVQFYQSMRNQEYFSEEREIFYQ